MCEDDDGFAAARTVREVCSAATSALEEESGRGTTSIV